MYLLMLTHIQLYSNIFLVPFLPSLRRFFCKRLLSCCLSVTCLHDISFNADTHTALQMPTALTKFTPYTRIDCKSLIRLDLLPSDI